KHVSFPTAISSKFNPGIRLIAGCNNFPGPVPVYIHNSYGIYRIPLGLDWQLMHCEALSGVFKYDAAHLRSTVTRRFFQPILKNTFHSGLRVIAVLQETLVIGGN